MSSPFTNLNAAIDTTLKASTALIAALGGSAVMTPALGGTSIYYMQAPEGKAYPYVVWSYQAGGPENINPSELHSSVIYIRCYDTNPARAGTVDGLVDAAIDGQTLTVTGWTNYWSAREQDIAIVENAPSQVPVYSVGALYRILMDK